MAKSQGNNSTTANLTELMSPLDTAIALRTAANLEDQLKVFLCSKLANLNNKLDKDLFTGFGPFNSFSAKIRVSHAMGIISKKLYSDLTIIKNIRNEFAHSSAAIHFKDDSIVTFLKKFQEYDSSLDPMEMFLKKIRECFEEMKPIGEKIAPFEALKNP